MGQPPIKQHPSNDDETAMHTIVCFNVLVNCSTFTFQNAWL